MRFDFRTADVQQKQGFHANATGTVSALAAPFFGPLFLAGKNARYKTTGTQEALRKGWLA